MSSLINYSLSATYKPGLGKKAEAAGMTWRHHHRIFRKEMEKNMENSDMLYLPETKGYLYVQY